MSNIGLNTNTFQVTGRYLDFLTDLIVKAKVSEDMGEEKREQLMDFISKVSDAKSIKPQFQLLSNIFERELRNSEFKRDVFFGKLLDEVKENNIKNIIPMVETIIGILDSENSDALSKIKGEYE